MPKYNPAQIEPKWQQFWEQQQTFRVPDLPGPKKLYVLDMFPYPSGDGLHVGHPEGYTATDIVCRFARMRGYDVLHPMGFDAFGLPAEEHAIKTNTPPRLQTEKNIDTFRRQLKMLGFSYDWQRELATTDVGYFRWTQWIFLVLFDTWFDPQRQQGRAIAELPIPAAIAAQGAEAVRRYQDEHRLAYQCDALVNWCPALGTVLANEEVIDGKSERGGHPVQRIPLRQWMLRITAYADRLERGLDDLDWPESIKSLQRNWIGAARVRKSISISVRRQTTHRGKHPGADRVARSARRRCAADLHDTSRYAVRRHLHGRRARTPVRRSPDDRRSTRGGPPLLRSIGSQERSGTHRVDQDQDGRLYRQPCGQPGQRAGRADLDCRLRADQLRHRRDHGRSRPRYARLRIRHAVSVARDRGRRPGAQADTDRHAVLSGQQVFTEDGTAVNSGPYNGLSTDRFQERITADLAQQGLGRAAVNYKLRDWLFSRQRFWGEPFPILHELDEQGQPNGLMRTVPESDLPVDLPELHDYKPHGRPEPPLTKAPADWLYPVVDGRRYRRETNTMPQWAGSCWYYLRFIDPTNEQHPVDPEKERRWMPVDLYVGGAEHAVLHLLYSRFWHHVLYDRQHVSMPEPFRKLINQGMILGEMEYHAYQDANGQWVGADEVQSDGAGQPVRVGDPTKPLQTVRLEPAQVEKRGDVFVLAAHPDTRVESRAFKMSKSRGNVVNPDEIVREYGADSLRLYEMFMGPLEATKPWSMSGVDGVRKFLDRVWRLIIDEKAEQPQLHEAVQATQPSDAQNRTLHKTIKAVTHDLESLSFNTAIARMMEFVNYFNKETVRPQSVMNAFVLLLSPLAPHLAEELWQHLGHDQSLAYEPWPAYDETLTLDETIEVPVQVQGKLRSRIRVPAGAGRDELEAAARADEKIAQLLRDQVVLKTVVVPGRLVNFVTRGG